MGFVQHDFVQASEEDLRLFTGKSAAPMCYEAQLALLEQQNVIRVQMAAAERDLPGDSQI